MILPSLIALLAPLQVDSSAPSPHHQFDFWIGEWSVQNRHFQEDGSWKDGDVTRARITPVCGHRAVLEEWAGPFRGSFMNGFSLRAYDPAREDWDLLLFWTTDGNGGFGRLRGGFRHGRGEFFSGAGDDLQRYTFSDALPDSVRWDSALTSDGGRSWRTDWIMEFSRTAPASSTTQEHLFEIPWSEGELSPHAEARAMDWALGSWTGTYSDLAGERELEARLRCKLLDKDCLLLDLLETRAPGEEDWHERLAVRGYVAQRGAWESHRLSEDDPVLRGAVGRPTAEVAVFEEARPGGGLWREAWRPLEDDGLAIELEEREGAAGALELRAVVELRRIPDRPR